MRLEVEGWVKIQYKLIQHNDGSTFPGSRGVFFALDRNARCEKYLPVGDGWRVAPWPRDVLLVGGIDRPGRQR